mgnify:CR=1 FL=1
MNKTSSFPKPMNFFGWLQNLPQDKLMYSKFLILKALAAKICGAHTFHFQFYRVANATTGYWLIIISWQNVLPNATLFFLQCALTWRHACLAGQIRITWLRTRPLFPQKKMNLYIGKVRNDKGKNFGILYSSIGRRTDFINTVVKLKKGVKSRVISMHTH